MGAVVVVAVVVVEEVVVVAVVVVVAATAAAVAAVAVAVAVLVLSCVLLLVSIILLQGILARVEMRSWGAGLRVKGLEIVLGVGLPPCSVRAGNLTLDIRKPCQQQTKNALPHPALGFGV